MVEHLESARSTLETAVAGADDGTLQSLLPLTIDVETKLQDLCGQTGQPKCRPKSVPIMSDSVSAMQGRLDALPDVDEDDEDGEDSPEVDALGAISDVSLTDSEPKTIEEEEMANTAVMKRVKTVLENANEQAQRASCGRRTCYMLHSLLQFVFVSSAAAGSGCALPCSSNGVTRGRLTQSTRLHGPVPCVPVTKPQRARRDAVAEGLHQRRR